VTQPLTRDLRETIRALEVAEAEYLFQADRLANRTDATTDQEREHLADLEQGYRSAARYSRILLNYHEGRARLRDVRPSNAAQDEAIDRTGRATAYTSDRE
jgi:hypothetical protein